MSSDTLAALVHKRRSIRRFRPQALDRERLQRYVDGARMGPSASNRQPLQFLVVDEPQRCAAVFPHTAWAGYLKDGAPPAGKRPVAYVFILIDTNINPKAQWDVGIAAQTIALLAVADGVGSCLLGALKRDALKELFQLPASLEISLAVGLGYPDEAPVAEPWDPERDDPEAPRYYRDSTGRLHVPKRNLKDVVHFDELRSNDR
jgi:nitroreductase